MPNRKAGLSTILTYAAADEDCDQAGNCPALRRCCII